MLLLLDTQVLYWAFYEQRRLSAKALEVIHGASQIFVSSASVWEMAIKVRLGKMKADLAKLVSLMDQAGFEEMPVWSRHALLVGTLPMHHADPFDRLLIAQAISEGLHLLTADEQLRRYSELVVVV